LSDRLLVPRSLYGAWIYPETSENIYLTSQSDNKYQVIDKNLIRDTKTNKYLVRAGLESVVTTGKFYAPQTYATRSTGYAGIGGIEVLLKNIKDPNIQVKAITDDNGHFNDDTLPSGDYKLTARLNDRMLEKDIALKDLNENLGNFMLLDSNTKNFKAEVLTNYRFMYAGGDYNSGYVRVSNISLIDGIGLSFNITTDDEVVSFFEVENTLGTVQAGKYIDVPFIIVANQIRMNEKLVNLNVVIRDINGNEWNDRIPLKFYRDRIRLTFNSHHASVKGYVSCPNNNQLPLNIFNGIIDLPTLMNNDYYIVLANSSLNDETTYSIGYQASAASLDDLKDFKDTSRYESINGTPSGAVLIPEGSHITAYLHIGDIDFYKVSFKENAFLFDQVVDGKINQSYRSNQVQITHEILQYGKTAVIDEGTFYVNGEASGQAVTLKENDMLSVELQSPKGFETQIKSTITIGELITSYQVLTEPERTTITRFELDDILDLMPATEYISNPIHITGINTVVDVITTAGTIIKNDEEIGQQTTAVEGDVIKIKLSASTSFETAVSATVTIGDLTETFSISTVSVHRAEQEARYLINGDGTVTDIDMNITWLRCSFGQEWNGETCIGEANYYTWSEAQDLVAEKDFFAGAQGWRVPTLEELKSTIFCSSGQKNADNNCFGSNERPTILTSLFPNTAPYFYWSASPYADSSYYAWGVFFDDGNDHSSYLDGYGHVRLVRSGQ
jgi:hypothetical protein